MLQGLRTVVYHVPDLDAAKRWYAGVLGYDPYFDEPFYVGFDVGGYELGLVPAEGDRAGGMDVYWGVEDADAAIAALAERGAEGVGAVHDVGGGIRLGTVRTPAGNALGVIYNPHFRAR
jgi:catechol 2,3-dioxygenase-like lactoylglutathione lyase family enzyme